MIAPHPPIILTPGMNFPFLITPCSSIISHLVSFGDKGNSDSWLQHFDANLQTLTHYYDCDALCLCSVLYTFSDSSAKACIFFAPHRYC